MKGDGIVAGLLKPHLLAMHTPRTTDSQAPVVLGNLICTFAMPCGCSVRSTPCEPVTYTSMLPRSGLLPLYLHCRLSYRHEFGTALAVKYGGGGAVYVPECLVVSSESLFHETLCEALSLFVSSPSSLSRTFIAPTIGIDERACVTVIHKEITRAPMLEELANALTCDVPPPKMPLYLQIASSAVHCQRPDARDLPLADLDFAPLLRALDSRNVARLLVLLMAREPQLVLVSDTVGQLFPTASALLELLYPFTWSHAFVPVLPPSLLAFLDSPHPYILGVHRPCVPRGRLPSHVIVADLAHDTLTVPPELSDCGLEEVVSLIETRISACKDALSKAHKEGLLSSYTQPHIQSNQSAETASAFLPSHVRALGAWGSASACSGAGVHSSVEALRQGVAQDLSQFLYRYPLFLHAPKLAASKQAHRASLDGVTFDAAAFSNSSDEHVPFVRAISATKMFTGEQCVCD